MTEYLRDRAAPSSTWSASLTPPVRTAIAMALICSLLFHGSQLLIFGIDPDEEHMLGPVQALGFISQGRWGAYLLFRFLLPESIFPITAPTLFLVFYGAAFV